MIRAVLDTNTIVSGLGWGGPPGAVLDAALAGHFEIVTSPALLDELRRVLAGPPETTRAQRPRVDATECRRVRWPGNGKR